MTTRRTLFAAAMLTPLVGSPGWSAGRVTAEASGPLAVTVERDIVYGEVDGETLVLDAYRPPAREVPRPAVILIHGGGWSGGGRSDMAGAAKLLAEAGYVALNVEYRLLTFVDKQHTWPTQLDDVQRAVRWTRANAAAYSIDPKRVASYGHSAGGHLAAMLGVRDTRDNSDPDLADYSSRVACVVDLAGDMDLFLPYPSEYDNQLVRDYLGGTAAELPEVYRDASPIAWVDEATVPFLLVHSAQDEVNPVAHARRMAEALHEAGIDTVYVELAHGGHMSPGTWTESGPWTLTFLGIHLRPDR